MNRQYILTIEFLCGENGIRYLKTKNTFAFQQGAYLLKTKMVCHLLLGCTNKHSNY